MFFLEPAKSYRERQRRRRAAQVAGAVAVLAAGAGAYIAWDSPQSETTETPAPLGERSAASEPTGDLFDDAEAPLPSELATPHTEVELAEHPLRQEFTASAETTTSWTPTSSDDTPQWLTLGMVGSQPKPEARAPWSDFDLAPANTGIVAEPPAPADLDGAPAAGGGFNGPVPAFLSTPDGDLWPQGLFGVLSPTTMGPPEEQPEAATDETAETEN